ncbi:hypothetical protein [Nonomuraea sp. SYSU D8015]|uniref:hypothetical protein n=1 Tax=Nonomuraea sp. SYSU D8015 TaxID=2593644 RepID=UPI001660A1D7|nr:hypothetical protein [Nonomuraea sp. SYSU D8015]
MGRHRLKDYDLVEVSPAYAPAVARREPPDDPNGRLIIEVDASLRGQEREEAIDAALEPAKQGWLGIIPAPLLAFAHEHPRAAAAIASAGAAATIGIATLTITSVPDSPGGQPGAIAASVSQTAVIVPASPGTPPPTTTTGQPSQGRPDRSEPPAGGGRDPRGSDRPAPTSETGRPVTATHLPPAHPTADPQETVDRKPAPPPAASPTVDAPPPTPRPDPLPTRPPAAPVPSPTRPHVDVEADVKDRKVGAKVGDLDVDVDVDELEVEVDDVLNVDVKERQVGVGDLEVDLDRVRDRLRQ